MVGPIDYIVVGFEGNKFDGGILKALAEALDSGVIGLITLSIISKDTQGVVSRLDVADLGDEYIIEFAEKYNAGAKPADQDDIDEVGDLLKNNCTAGLLVVEQLWAKPLKKAILDAKGFLIAEGRIHPEAAAELDGKVGE